MLKNEKTSEADSGHTTTCSMQVLSSNYFSMKCSFVWVVTWKKHPGVSGLTPDFRVTQDQKSIYVEATAVGERSNPFYRSRNEQGVIDTLNRLSSPDFFHRRRYARHA